MSTIQLNNHNRVIAIIPARSNSKRIPSKNTKILGDKPLLMYTLETACQSDLITDIYVSTDSADIIELVNEWRSRELYSRQHVCAVHRPNHLALDHVQVSEVMLHTLRLIEQQEYGGSIIPDDVHIVSLAPTSPFRSLGTLNAVISKHIHSNPKGVTLTAAIANGYYWQDGLPKNHDPSRRYGWQDNKSEFPPTLRENGSIYVINAKKFSLETVMRFAPYVVVQDDDNIDLDTPEDWDKAEQHLKEIKENV